MFEKDEPKSTSIPISEEEERMPSTEEALAEGAAEGVAEEVAGALEKRLAELAAEVAEAREAHLRAVADLQNFRRRAADERAQQLQFANEQLISEMLPLMDNFERATGCEIEGEAAQNLLRGVCMIQQQFRDLLTRFGVERMSVAGEMFDPGRHDAIARVETNEACEGTIVEEVAPGYVLHGRVIRPARVKVAVEPR